MNSRFKLKLFSLEKKTLVSVTAAGIAGFLVCLGIALGVAPPMTDSNTVIFYQCSNQVFNCISNQTSQEYSIRIDEVNQENNYLYIELTPYLTGSSPSANFSLLIENSTGTEVTFIESTNYILYNDIVVLTSLLSFATEASYTVILKSYNPLVNVSSLKLTISYMNRDFFYFTLAVKYSFFTWTLAGIVLFFYRTRKIQFRHLHFETLAVLFISFSVLVFNEPLFAAYTHTALFGIAATAISVFCNVQFMCALVLFWLFMLQKLNNPYCQCIIKLTEFVFICSLFSFMFVIYVYVESNLKYDPNYNWENDLDQTRKVIYPVLIAVLSLFAVWMIVLIAMSMRKWKEPRFSRRQKWYWGFNYGIIVITYVFIGLGYIQIMQYGRILLSVVALYNIYFFILLYISTPDYSSYKRWVDESSEHVFSLEDI